MNLPFHFHIPYLSRKAEANPQRLPVAPSSSPRHHLPAPLNLPFPFHQLHIRIPCATSQGVSLYFFLPSGNAPAGVDKHLTPHTHPCPAAATACQPPLDLPFPFHIPYLAQQAEAVANASASLPTNRAIFIWMGTNGEYQQCRCWLRGEGLLNPDWINGSMCRGEGQGLANPRCRATACRAGAQGAKGLPLHWAEGAS